MKENIEDKSKKHITIAQKRDSMIKVKERKDRKAGSVYQIHQDNKNININFNQNININANIKQKEKEKEKEKKSYYTIDKKKTIEFHKKGKKMKSCILTLEKGNINHKNNNFLHLPNLQGDNNQNKDYDSSFKMDNLAAKQTESKNEKKEQFLEFYINNNLKNKEYALKNNLITTTKYNIFNFIPKSLLYQFSRLSNVYFLFTAIIQSIPLISPLTSLTAIIPLIFVLGVSMIRELIEDLVRNNYDKINNEEEVIVFRNKRFIKSMSETLQCGEIILVYENRSIPADMVLIDSGFGEGICYVETSSLDGEKTLKLKVANKYTQGFISSEINVNKGIDKSIQPNEFIFEGFIKINVPNIDLNYINGTIHSKFIKDSKVIEEDINISTNEFLLKGSILKNTNWIIGIVVYTGMNNKIILNSRKPRLKMSKVEKSLNYYLLFIFLILILCCIECSLYHHFAYIKHKKFYDNFIFISNSISTESFIIFFTYFLLLNTMIPISLIVSTEIIKMIQGIFIGWDILLYSKWRHCFCSIKSVSIIEELGNVNFIFSDKTGTLTKNQLQFKYCIIDNNYYQFFKKSAKLVNNSEINNNITFVKVKKKSFNFINKSLKRINGESELFNNSNNNSRILLNNLEENSFNEDENESNNHYSENRSITKIYKGKILSNNTLNKLNLNKRENSINNKFSRIENDININLKIKNNIYNKMSSMNDSLNLSNNRINKFHKFGIKNESDSESKSGNKSKDKSVFDKNLFKASNEDLGKKRNSTILEANNEECDSSSTIHQIIQFGEDYFSIPQNNPFIHNIDSPKDSSINYINEFWKALALTNECIVKEDKGELKYMGTSPDDLELVKAAMQQGYKLVNTTINTKTIRIAGIDYSYEILKVLGFSSERKRMSIIVKDKTGIKLYIKGADCEISKRLSKKSLNNENFKSISNGLIEFSKRGLRTLMIAFRKIRQEDYDSWVNKLHEDELNIQNKQKLIDRLYDFIENNLILIGGTVVEDKLQDKVPETIRELRAAGIKIWVLTGDKLDTAENIGYSCNLLSKEQKLFTLKLMPGDDEDIVKNDPYPEMLQFLGEFQEFIDDLVRKYNLDTKYTRKYMYGNQDEINNVDDDNDYNLEILSNLNYSHYQNDYKSSSSMSSKVLDLEVFKYLKEKEILEPYSIIIEAPILCGLFKDEEWTSNFLNIAYYSRSVICCRVSPSQKSEVIQKMKNFDKNAVTLAIGDGGNDVSMIMEANIGIGIYGEEGLSAAQSSDFAIGEFKLLQRLLFIHGRINLYRTSNMILYFFYKNFVFTLLQFFFSFFSLASGQTLIDDWYITCYNLIFTAFPLFVSATTDSDIDLNDEKEKKRNFALLYKENRDTYRIFSFSEFSKKLIKGIFVSLVIFGFCLINEILVKGRNYSIWYLSLKCYISTLIIVSINLLMANNFIVYLLPLTIGITTFLLFIIFLNLNHYGLLFSFNSKASIFPSLTSLITYISLIIVCFVSIIVDYTLKLLKIYFNNSLSSRLILERANKNQIKSLFGGPSKSYTKHSKERRKNNLSLDERSKSYIESQTPKNNKLNYIIHNKSPNSKINLNYIKRKENK